ncbi:hypothetical protein RF55_26147 [Lasius niger]|uniref:Uncharacterized protein n=1 Tax=Lasius niger TaxID=67767 RepID=A0A0J7JU02_LASNI|nr:hypothetical protein RF55_26147 [Lasius niger]
MGDWFHVVKITRTSGGFPSQICLYSGGGPYSTIPLKHKRFHQGRLQKNNACYNTMTYKVVLNNTTTNKKKLFLLSLRSDHRD